MNSFLADGGDGFAVLTRGHEPGRSAALDVDAFAQYLSAHQPLTPPATDRISGSGRARGLTAGPVTPIVHKMNESVT